MRKLGYQMGQTLCLLASRFLGARIGGYTKNQKWIEMNLQRTSRDRLQLIAESHPEGLGIYSAIYPSGGYVVIYQHGPGLFKPRMVFVHFELSQERISKRFSGMFKPDAIQRIVHWQGIIASQGAEDQESVLLTDEP